MQLTWHLSQQGQQNIFFLSDYPLHRLSSMLSFWSFENVSPQPRLVVKLKGSSKAIWTKSLWHGNDVRIWASLETTFIRKTRTFNGLKLPCKVFIALSKTLRFFGVTFSFVFNLHY